MTIHTENQDIEDRLDRAAIYVRLDNYDDKFYIAVGVRYPEIVDPAPSVNGVTLKQKLLEHTIDRNAPLFYSPPTEAYIAHDAKERIMLLADRVYAKFPEGTGAERRKFNRATSFNACESSFTDIDDARALVKHLSEQNLQGRFTAEQALRNAKKEMASGKPKELGE